MPVQPAFVGKRMRELLDGAAIGIIPFPIDPEHFGTIDELDGFFRRFMILGYERPQAEGVIWSIYAFLPNVARWEYNIAKAKVQLFMDLPRDENGALLNPDDTRTKAIIEESEGIAYRGKRNYLMDILSGSDPSWGGGAHGGPFGAKEAIALMSPDHALNNRPEIKEFIEYWGFATQANNDLNIFGDTEFIFHDYGFFKEFKYTCDKGIIKQSAFSIVAGYARET